MEESITLKDFLAYYKKTMRLEPVDAGSYSPLVLAYIGDAVYEVMIRARVINRGSMQVNKMHKRASELVKAETQARFYKLLEARLTPEEQSVYRRGRNAKSATMPKHATMRDYRMATGFEALIGYLYLTEQMERMAELLGAGLDAMGELSEMENRE